MRMLFRTTIAALLAGLLAYPAASDPLPRRTPLPPGQPAGVKTAQLESPDPILFIGLGIAIVGVGFYLANGKDVNTSGVIAPTGTP
jgi:hypothetical protein